MKKLHLISILLFLLFSTLSGFSNDDKFVVVIDAGHGGKDTGATRGSIKEKSINLGVALTLGKLIESNMKNVKIIYTRKSDVFVDLYKRAEIANKAKANLFISIHTNSTAAKNTAAQGADTYILGLARSEENKDVAKRENSVILLEDNYTKRYEGFDPRSPESYIIFEFMTDKYMEQSLEFASHVQKGFTNIARRKNRGVHQAGFLVLRETAMPSVLIELGFINNPTEANYLNSTVGQKNMASSIYSGIEKYITDFQKRQMGSTVTSQIKSKEKINPDKSQPKPTVKEKIENNNNNITQINESIVSKPNKDVFSLAEKKPEMIKEVKEKDVIKSDSTVLDEAVEYRIQILISQVRLSLKSPAFKGLSPIQEYKDGKTYKYTYGSVKDEASALKLRNEARAKFKDAFVVEFKKGVRIK